MALGAAPVVWIGGPPGSGKTTVARRLARRHGLRLYSADTRTWAHRDRALADDDPAAVRWEAQSPAERGFAPKRLAAPKPLTPAPKAAAARRGS